MTTSRTPGIDTLAIHGAGARSAHAHDAMPTPIVCTATYSFTSTAELRDHFEGRVEREEYGRYGNPTVQSCERKLAALDGAEDAALFSSGMGAITTALFAMLKSGDHLVLTSDCYRRTRQFAQVTLAKFGIAALEAAIVPGKTKLVFTELPTNPYLRVVDIGAFAEVVRKHRGVKLLVDSTFATPVNLRPLEHGAHLAIHSCTKYLAGHNDVLAGSIAGSRALVGAVREFRGVLGGVLDPHAAFLVERGIKTLPLRVRQQNASGLAVARFLEKHPAVREVFYPGLESHPEHALAARLLAGAGGVVSFRLRADLETTSRFIDACKLATLAPSLGGTETLIEQPALMSFYELSTEERLAIGVHEDLVRLSVGIESLDDIVADLEQALATVTS
jgi:cystathionine gamma-synthase